MAFDREGGRGKGEGLRAVSRYLLILSLLPLSALAAPLSEVVARVLEQHPDVRSAAAMVRAADAAVGQARSPWFPTVGVQQSNGSSLDRPAGASTYSTTTTRRGEAYVRWNLFNGYADYYGTRSAQYSQDAAEADLEEAREAVATRVAEIYIEVLRLSEQLRLTQSYVQDLERLARDVHARAEAGRIPMVETEQARSRLVRAQSELSQQRAQHAAATNAYRQVIGVPPAELVRPALDEALADEPLEKLQARAEETNPKLKAAQERVRARDADVGMATGALLPQLNLEARKRISPVPDANLLSDQARSQSLQLSLEIPLGGKHWFRRSEQVERKLAAQADADSKALQLRLDMGELHANLREARLMAPLLARNLVSSGQVAEAYRLQFSAGRRSLLDLLTVREDLYQSQTQELGNRYGRLTSTVRLEHLLGTLRQALMPARAAMDAK